MPQAKYRAADVKQTAVKQHLTRRLVGGGTGVGRGERRGGCPMEAGEAGKWSDQAWATEW